MPIIQTKKLNGLFVNGNWQIYVYEIIFSSVISFPKQIFRLCEYLDVGLLQLSISIRKATSSSPLLEIITGFTPVFMKTLKC